MSQKSVAVIEDISGFGRCSLTVALPIISAVGIKTSVIPTAVLSTHTGGFINNTFRDLTGDIEPISEHWKRESFKFDTILTGYICSPAQVYAVMSAVDNIRSENTKLIVDPAMGDNGYSYSGFNVSFPGYMLRLCQKADVITPNITEACMLTGTPYKKGVCTKEYIEQLLARLYEMTNADIVLTGVGFDDKKIGVAIFEKGKITYAFTDKLPRSFHGTGDIFASVLAAAVTSGRGLCAAAQMAVNFVCACIKQTIDDKADARFGVDFEKKIPELIKYFNI